MSCLVGFLLMLLLLLLLLRPRVTSVEHCSWQCSCRRCRLPGPLRQQLQTCSCLHSCPACQGLTSQLPARMPVTCQLPALTPLTCQLPRTHALDFTAGLKHPWYTYLQSSNSQQEIPKLTYSKWQCITTQ
jgi:hypothetical protein